MAGPLLLREDSASVRHTRARDQRNRTDSIHAARSKRLAFEVTRLRRPLAEPADCDCVRGLSGSAMGTTDVRPVSGRLVLRNASSAHCVVDAVAQQSEVDLRRLLDMDDA
jgi:hypothetical protein